MLLENLRRVFKRPDREQELKNKRQIDGQQLEKSDLPAMVLSAYMVFIPIALLTLGVIALVAFLLIN